MTSCVILCDVIKICSAFVCNVLKTILIFSIYMTRTCCTFHLAKSKDVYLIAFSLIIIFTSLDGINEFMTKNINWSRPGQTQSQIPSNRLDY